VGKIGWAPEKEGSAGSCGGNAQGSKRTGFCQEKKKIEKTLGRKRKELSEPGMLQ